MEELRLQLFLFFLNYWRLYKNMGVDMGDITRAICESMPDIPVCALEGCDTLLFGYIPRAIYCTDNCRRSAYQQTPRGKDYMKDYERKRIRPPERKAYMKAYIREYHARKKAERLAAEE